MGRREPKRGVVSDVKWVLTIGTASTDIGISNAHEDRVPWVKDPRRLPESRIADAAGRLWPDRPPRLGEWRRGRGRMPVIGRRKVRRGRGSFGQALRRDRSEAVRWQVSNG